MKGVTAEITNCAKIFAFVGTHYSLCRVFHNEKMIMPCNIHNRIHFTGHTGVMHDYDDFGFIRDGSFDFLFINVHRIRTYIDKNKLCSHHYSCSCRAGKGKGREDHFITRFQITQEQCHIQSRSTAGC